MRTLCESRYQWRREYEVTYRTSHWVKISHKYWTLRLITARREQDSITASPEYARVCQTHTFSSTCMIHLLLLWASHTLYGIWYMVYGICYASSLRLVLSLAWIDPWEQIPTQTSAVKSEIAGKPNIRPELCFTANFTAKPTRETMVLNNCNNDNVSAGLLRKSAHNRALIDCLLIDCLLWCEWPTHAIQASFRSGTDWSTLSTLKEWWLNAMNATFYASSFSFSSTWLAYRQTLVARALRRSNHPILSCLIWLAPGHAQGTSRQVDCLIVSLQGQCDGQQRALRSQHCREYDRYR